MACRDSLASPVNGGAILEEQTLLRLSYDLAKILRTSPDEVRREIREYFGRTIDWLEETGRLKFDDLVLESVGDAVKPPQGATLAVAPSIPKTASLVFDKVWAAGFQKAPQDLSFRNSTAIEHIFVGTSLLRRGFSSWLAKVGEQTNEMEMEPELSSKVSRLREELSGALPDLLQTQARLMTEALQLSFQSEIPLILNSNLDTKEPPASNPARLRIAASLQGLRIVDEDSLSWDQVQDFRSDSESAARLRRLMVWYQSHHLKSSRDAFEDDIGRRIDDYEASLRKHGIETKWGALSSLLDPKGIFAAGSTLAFLRLAEIPELGLLASTGVYFGNVLLKLGKFRDERRHLKGTMAPEIAFYQDVKTKLGET